MINLIVPLNELGRIRDLSLFHETYSYRGRRDRKRICRKTDRQNDTQINREKKNESEKEIDR